MRKAVLLLVLMLVSLPLAAQYKNNTPSGPAGPRVVTAVRADVPIVIDGRLDEKVWQTPPHNGFIQTDPRDGEPATEKTDVWMAYDDHGLYVAAFCHDSEPGRIIRRLGRRDAQVDSDWFMVAIDPYYDKRTGYLFGVNPSGSIIDQALSNDVVNDSSWDGVWQWGAAVNDKGWSVEIRIPFSQVRFSKKEEYVWGVNFRRVIMRKNETASFSWVPKNETAFVSRFARLEGLRGISPGTHLELMPYVTGQSRFRPAEAGNPFETGSRWLGGAGLDLKWGLKSNLTLDASVNPDFGQVEVDPAVINLSAYETYYQEKRPFFIEGASTFDSFGRGGVYMNADMYWPNPQFFYSRRIGRAPQGYVTSDGYVDFPGRTTILGAAKLTGKLGGWNVGFLNALTAREFARIDLSGTRLREEVEPFSYYSVVRAQKDVRQGRHGLGFMATSVMRDLDNQALAGILNQNAFSLAVDGWSFLDKKRTYVASGWLGGTRVEGSVEDILRLQYSSTHYFQRPDATHVEIDPAATSLSGWGGRLQFAKQRGNFIFVLAAGALSPGFDINDAGFQARGSDHINFSILPAYQWTKPGRIFQYALVALGAARCYDFGGNKVQEAGIILGQATFRNFWNAVLQLTLAPDRLNNELTRGGPLAVRPAAWRIEYILSTDSRRAIVLNGLGSISGTPGDGRGWSTQLSVNWKPRPNLSLSIGPQFSLLSTETQWVTRVPDALMTSTFGRRYVYGRIDQKIIAAEFRLDWTFTPKLSVQAYLQPFVAVGRYDRFKELARPSAYAYNIYGENGSTIDFADGLYTVDPDGENPAAAFSFGNPDFNMKSLRGTVVLRWEFRPGSLLYFVWTQNRANYAHPGDLRLWRDLNDLMTAPGDNILMLKISYFWNR